MPEIDFMLALPTWPGILMAISFSTACGLVVYLTSHRWLVSLYTTFIGLVCTSSLP